MTGAHGLMGAHRVSHHGKHHGKHRRHANPNQQALNGQVNTDLCFYQPDDTTWAASVFKSCRQAIPHYYVEDDERPQDVMLCVPDASSTIDIAKLCVRVLKQWRAIYPWILPQYDSELFSSVTFADGVPAGNNPLPAQMDQMRVIWKTVTPNDPQVWKFEHRNSENTGVFDWEDKGEFYAFYWGCAVAAGTWDCSPYMLFRSDFLAGSKTKAAVLTLSCGSAQDDTCRPEFTYKDDLTVTAGKEEDKTQARDYWRITHMDYATAWLCPSEGMPVTQAAGGGTR